ncbi:MAG: alcohol dehydrogenase [Gammaproteobacteria bacterium]|nr:alcohol dehydrogenase [Gammaproteobacteria bacterium]
MRAAVFRAAGEPLAIEPVAGPSLGIGELLIAVKCCGICGSDLHMAELHSPAGGMSPLPRGSVMGHEFTGEIVEVSPQAAASWRVGERVTALPYIACGGCHACLAGQGYRCAQVRYTGIGNLPGGYAEFLRIGAAETLRLPDGVDWQRGALVEPMAVGLHAVNAARLVAGDAVLVLGAGPIGLATALWCRYFGARHVIVCDKVPERLGATATIAIDREEVVGRFKRIAGTRPAVVFECVGVPGMQQLAMDYAPAGGRIIIVGVCMATDHIEPVKAISKELTVNYVFMYRRQDFELAIDLLDRERIDPSAMLTATVGFDAFPGVFESLKTDKRACKVMLTP